MATVNPKTGATLVETGPRTLARSIPLNAVTTWQRYEFPAGSNITNVTVEVDGNGLLSTDVEGNIVLLIYLDADSAAARDAACGTAGAPTAGTPLPGLYKLPLKTGIISIPLDSPLSSGSYGGGVIDVRSQDGKSLNCLITVG